MTVAADLATAHGALCRSFLRVDGLPYVLNQRVADPTGDDSPLSSPATGIIHPATSAEYCVAAWRFSGASGADETDATGNGHTAFDNGTIGAQTGKFPDGARGPFSTAKFFNVTDGAWQNLQEFTVAVWFYVANTSQYRYAKIVSREHADADMSNSWSIMTPNGDGTNNLQANHSIIMATIVATDGTVAGVTDTEVLAVGWHHAVMAVDVTKTLRLWVDRRYVGSSSTIAGKTIRYDTRDLYIGRDYDAIATYQWWNGWVDDLAIYSVAKDASWVSRVYGGGLNCLRVPSTEFAHDLDLKDMSIKPSAMTFELDDIDDPDESGTSFFGKLFAPGRWDSSDAERTTTCRVSLASTGFAADAATITCKKTDSFDNFPTAGTAYLGPCTVTYTGKGTQATTNTGGYFDATLGTLTGCVLGEYSAVQAPRGTGTTSMGFAIKHPVEEDWTATDAGRGHVISTVPYTWMGKRVALYVTTWDAATAAWNSVDDAQLAWVGRLSDAIQYDPKRRVWRLSCEHAAADFDAKIMASAPTARLCGINLNSLGDWGRAWQVWEFASGLPVCVSRFTVESGFYSPSGLARAIAGAMNDWSAWNDANHAVSFVCQLHQVDGSWEFAVRSKASDHSWIIYPDGSELSDLAAPNPCHAWQVFGFTEPFTVGGADGDGKKTGGKGYSHYHPLDLRMNGETMMVLENGTDYLWSSQGDYGTALAYVEAKKAKVDGETDGPYVTAYTARTEDQTINYYPSSSAVVISGATKLTLANGSVQPPAAERTVRGFLGGEGETDYPEIRNALVATWRDYNGRLRGPFEALLYPLLSTGTTDYNSATYDKLPAEASLGVPSAIVNTTSFLDADREVLSCYPSLALRRFYPISKATSWRTLFEREAKLFGYALTWKSGQWTLVNVMHPERQSIDVTLDDGNTAYVDDWPVINMSMDTTINRWEFKLDYDYSTDKYRTTISIRDEESWGASQTVRSRELEHPGVLPQKSDYATRALVQIKVNDEMFIMRRPWQVVRRTLSPTLFGTLAVGDVVNYHVDTATHPDPMGSGARTCDAIALILGLRWNFATGSGACTLLVYGQDETRITPWAPAAVVDFGATNGGWDAGNSILTLLEEEFRTASTEPVDGARFAAGDKLLIMERAPSDPASPTLTPAVLTVVSYTTLTKKLEIEEGTITGFDTTGETEYVLTFADYATAVAAQLDRGTWQAAPATHLLNAADRAKAYG